MFKIQQGKNKSLQTLAGELYLRLNPVKRNTNTLKKNSLKKRLAKKIRQEKDVQRKTFYQFLAANNYKILKEIVTGEPTKLNAIQNHIDNLVASKAIPTFYDKVGEVIASTSFGMDVLNLFNYTSCRGSVKFVWLVEELNINICPYCNYEHTFKIKTNDSVLILHEFDHFIPKVIAPYFSISFFNLIPSCHNCNATLKRTAVFQFPTYVHPYQDDLHSYINFTIDKPIFNNDVNSFDVSLKIKTIDSNEIIKVKNSTGVFQIQPRYNNFKEEILRLERKRHQYTDKVKLELLNSGIFGKVFMNRDDVLKHIADELDIPQNENEAMRKEKGKFKMDIAKEFKILD